MISRSQIDAALPHVPAGIAALGGDLTDPDDRQIAVEWLWGFVRDAQNRAERPLCGPESAEQGSECVDGADEAETGFLTASIAHAVERGRILHAAEMSCTEGEISCLNKCVAIVWNSPTNWGGGAACAEHLPNFPWKDDHA